MIDATNHKTQRKKQLTIRYMLAVILVFCLSLSSLIVLEYIIKLQDGYGSVINVSGRQRMLSQQIALLSHELFECSPKEKCIQLRERLHDSLKLLETSHKHLTSGNGNNNSMVTLSPTLREMYFSPPFAVDQKVTEYISSVNDFLMMTSTSDRKVSLKNLSVYARGPLLTALNAVVKQYEKESNRYTEILKSSALLTFFLMIILLIALIVFGFRPMVNVVVENENMLNSILDSIPILMDIVSSNGTILYQSKFLIDLQGKATIGQKCFNAYASGLTHCDACPIPPKSHNLDKKAIALFDKLGPGIVVEISHLHIIFKGEKALLHTYQDITEQQKTEIFLRKAKEDADRASMAKSRFLANISHEIRTPMNAIIGFSDLTLETALDKTQTEYLGNIKHSSRSLLKIFDQILFFSQLETGSIPLQNKDFRIRETLEEMVYLFEDQAARRNISFTTHLDTKLPDIISGDGKQLQQILIQLLANSFKFTQHGSVTIDVRLHHLSDELATIRFSISDTGIGISKDQQKTLFDSFSQADESNTRKFGGIGLGLAITKRQVELMGGKLKVVSEPGQGSTFSFSISFSYIKSPGNSPSSKSFSRTKMVAGMKPTQPSPEKKTCPAIHRQSSKSFPFDFACCNEKAEVIILELLTKLESNQFDSTEKWNDLKGLLPSLESKTVKDIDNHISQYKFKEAAGLLSSILQQIQSDQSKRSQV